MIGPKKVIPTSTNGRTAVARFGTYAPVLAVLLAGVAAVGQFTYQQIGGRYGNPDLAVATSQGDTDAPADAALSPDPAGPALKFHLIGAGSSRPDEAIGSPQSRAGRRVVPAPEASAATDRVANNIEVRPSARISAASRVDDPAFGVLQTAFEAYERGDLKAAEAGYRGALTLSPRHPSGLHGLAALLQQTGRADESLPFYETLLTLDPNDTVAAAALLVGSEDSSGSISHARVRSLLQRHPRSAHLHFALGTALARESHWPDASVAFRDAVAIEPQNPEFIFNLAVSLDRLGRSDEARESYLAVLGTAGAASMIDMATVNTRIAELTSRDTGEGRAQ